jgi:hypothetical protein
LYDDLSLRGSFLISIIHGGVILFLESGSFGLYNHLKNLLNIICLPL